ncbi:hypothetical protein GCM10011614_25730 [Novosphingobium colocasiae]|uniref:Secreted protein n=2 Tax=Novosphingobium colocasiae TaxID=1256513 RepID=A0A918PIQ1_9SPHN|nr:hypothetical protein GCM10011614_25730 [Novosphingobium colocasiae]
MLRSRLAVALTATAAFAMTATPALARGHGGWHGGYGHRHHGGGIDGGDLLAGLLIVGGVAAIATAASNSARDRDRDRDRNDARDRDGGRYEDDSAGSDRGRDDAPVGARDQASGHFDDAVGVCADEIEKGDWQVDTVDTVTRSADRYSVSGRLTDGRGFACSIDDSGQVRSVAVDGHGVI